MSQTNEKKSHGFRNFLIVLLIIGLLIFGAVKLIEYKQTENPITAQGNSDGSTKLLCRSARISDIQVESELDLVAFGGKYIVTPKTDISGLEVTISFLDNNKKVLTSVKKSLGNVKEGIQTSFSISLFDLSFSVAINTKYDSLTVTGGTVSYFS